MVNFNEIVRRKRKKLGLTMAKLAMLAGVNRTYISKIENEGRTPSLEVVVELLIALGVTKQEFENIDLRKYPRKMIKTFLRGEE